MKHKFSLILFSILLSTTFAWAQTQTSAFYDLPDGAFVQGMSTTGTITDGEIYLPYKIGASYKFSSTTGTGDWWSNGKKQTTDKESYSYSSSNLSMNSKKTIPQLRQDGKVFYQYGATDGTKYNEDLYFYVGDSNMHYMTPAKLRADLVNKTSGQAHALTKYYKATKPDDTEVYDTIGLYFNNTDIMYIDGISIPIKNSSADELSDMFLNDDARVIVTFYKATAVGKKSDNALDRNTVYWTDTLTVSNYSQSSNVNTGALHKKFDDSIAIDGPFVVELTGYDNCRFNFYSAQERSSSNYWGYYIDNGNVIYPNKNNPSGNNNAYTLAVSVHAMFPVLYGKSDEDLTIETIPAAGAKKDEEASTDNRPSRTVYANHKYNALNKDGWSREHTISGITLNYGTRTDEYTKWYFTMSPNRTGAVREGDVIFNFRGKELKYHVTQKAPTLTPRTGMENNKEFKILFQKDDTVRINDVKVSEVYLESEVSLKDTIIVNSEKELTNIVKWFGNENGKYYVKFNFTRAKYVKEDTEDKITISFKDNPNNKYEYTILHEGAGEDNLKLRPNGASRIFVAGPKGDKIRVLDEEKNSLTNLKSIRVYSGVPASKLKLGWYEDEHLGYVNTENRSDEDGEYKLITPHVETTTEEDLLDSFYVCLPEWDTVKFYIRQEASARIWRDADLTKLEIGEAGGTAHFEGPTKEEVIIISNTPMEDDNVSITCAGWITPTKKINATGTKDTVRITFEVEKLTGNENRTDNIVITVHNQPVEISLTQKIPAFYDLPNGAFLAGMTNMGELADKTFYLPYVLGQSPTFTSNPKVAGKWTIEEGSTTDETTEYSYTSCEMKKSYHIPQLTRDNTVRYQYGATDSTKYDESLYFHVGDSVMRYMTPAKLWCDLAQNANGQAQKAIPNYRTINRDTVGVFFNNTDVMYIDSISIPISGGSEDYSLETMFPSDAKVYAKIYKATKATGKSRNEFDRKSKALRTIELTKDDFFKHPNYDYRGALTATVGEEPLAITGSFVIELTNLKKSGCNFYIYAAQERPGCNKWGYYVDDEGDETYPDYTPAISVHAMFPALYPKAYNDTVIHIPSGGQTLERTIFANCKYEEGSDWNLSVPEGIGLSVTKDSQDDNSTVWRFVMEANGTNDVREGDVTFTFRDKKLTYHVSQTPMVNEIILQNGLSLKKDSTFKIYFDFKPTAADLNEITWSSDNRIATVTVNTETREAVVKAVASGIDTIIAKSLANPTVTDTCIVTVFEVKANDDPATTTITAPAAGGNTTTVSFTLAVGLEFDAKNWFVNVPDRPDWITKATFTPSKESDNSTTVTCTLTASLNDTGSDREDSIIVTAFTDKFKYHITQEAAPAPEPDFTLENKAAGALATICLPNKIDSVGNATLYSISYGNTQMIEFVEADLENDAAGMPYLVQVAEAGNVNFFYGEGDAVTEPVGVETAKGFVGSLQEDPQDVPSDGSAILISGGRLRIAGTNCVLTKNHAYIDATKLPTEQEPISAPRRTIRLYNPDAAPTNLNGLNGTVKPMKVLRDGQLYIIRDTKTYNAQGIEL